MNLMHSLQSSEMDPDDPQASNFIAVKTFLMGGTGVALI
jgi:hypothetical protein